MVVKLLVKSIEAKDVHLLNTSHPIDVMFLPKRTVVSCEQFLNKPPTSDVTWSPISTDSKTVPKTS